jgi:PBP1b-binding outer membrane lipoprotein LpoB
MKVKLSILIFVSFFFVGCGGSKTYQAQQPAPANTVVTSDALIVTSPGSNVTYTTLSDGSIYIDCSGGCGDIYIGVEVPTP